MSRACSNWLFTFRDWTLARSEAPETYILWTGIFTLASVMRRRVVISKEWLGSWSVYPYVYILFVAPPGRARKTTTSSYADTLLDNIPGVNIAATATTPQALLKHMTELPEPSVSILSGEFAVFINALPDAMLDFLTHVFDGKDKHVYDTLARGVELVEKPCINLLGATTPKWIAEDMPVSAVEGGFASRVIFVYEERVRRRQLFYKELNYAKFKEMEECLRADLAHLSSLPEGEFRFTPDAQSLAEQWYRKNADVNPADDYRIIGYQERKPAHAFKLAMLLHLAYDDEYVIEERDFEAALKLLAQIESKMPRVYQNIGKNPYTTEMDAIKDYVEEKGSVPRAELLHKFKHVAEPERLMSLISALVAMEDIEVGGDPKEPCYKPVQNSSNHDTGLG